MLHTITKQMIRYILSPRGCRKIILIFVDYATSAYLNLSLNPARLIQLQIGVEFEASTRMQDTTTSFGYQLDVPKANLLFKGK